MRRPLAWVIGALAAVLLRRRTRPPVVDPVEVTDPRADELRRKLAESREIVEERDEFEAAETTVDEADVTVDQESRRRTVHDRAVLAHGPNIRVRGAPHGDLFGVWGSSASSVFAVGRNGTILHRAATGWSVMPHIFS